MPIGLVVFGDKSYSGKNRALSVLLISFTLSIFGRKARNNCKFRKPVIVIPNLSDDWYEEKSGGKVSCDSVQDTHDCLSVAFESLTQLHIDGNFTTSVLNNITIMISDNYNKHISIAYVILQTLSTLIHNVCISTRRKHNYASIQAIYWQQKEKAEAVMQVTSKHNIEDIFLYPHISLSRSKHSIYKLVPPAFVHMTK